jgi:hypothetical protein
MTATPPPAASLAPRACSPWELLAAAVAAAGAMGGVAAAAGTTLGLALGGFFVVALLLPPATAGIATLRGRLGCWAIISGVVAIVCLGLIGPQKATFGQWGGLLAIAAGLGLALIGLTAAWERIGFHPVLAAAASLLAGFAWLTWPIWLSPALAAGLGGRWTVDLVQIDPPLTANGILTFTPPWTEQTLAYQWTVLDQDVPIRLPASAFPCAAVHGLAGAALLAAAFARRRGNAPMT